MTIVQFIYDDELFDKEISLYFNILILNQYWWVCFLVYFQWEAFSAPELNNFLRVLDREEGELISQLEYKYKVMKKIIHQRMKELRREKHKEQVAKRESLHEQKYSPEHRKSTADSAVNWIVLSNWLCLYLHSDKY